MRGAKYRALTAQQIKPEGWLLRQLEIQAEGLSGHLDLVWPDIRESKWIGGDKEGWEHVPYWLDGFIPLAYLLDDEDLELVPEDITVEEEASETAETDEETDEIAEELVTLEDSEE